ELLGAAAYGAGKARHVSGIVVHGNVLSITLVRPAGDFLKRISMPNFCPAPIHGPLQRSNGAIPSAGPYYVAASSSEQIVLLRNPNYRGGRPRRSARIVYTSYRPTPQAVALTDRGAIDYLPPDFDNYSLLTPAGRARRHAVLYACPPQPRIEALVRANLASIGMAVSVDESTGCLQGEDPARDRADLILGSLGLGPADLDPAAFFDMAIGGAYNFPTPGPGPWTSPAFRVRLERARALRGYGRIAAYARLQQELL